MNTILQEYNNIESCGGSVDMASSVLIVDEKEKFREKIFHNMIGVDNIVTIDDITKAKDILYNHANGVYDFQVLVISAVFVDKVVKNNELLDFLQFFPGSVIVRCDNEADGLKLLRDGLATDYYISDTHELENLKRAVDNAVIHNRCLLRLAAMNDKFKALEVIKNSINKAV